MPRLFAYIDYRSLGVHEPPRPDHTAAVYDSVTERGYSGPAISTFFTFEDEWMDDVEPHSILEDVPYGVIGVADGHNRLETFRKLDDEGRLRSPIIPIQLAPVHNPWMVRFYDNEKPHSEDVGKTCAYCVGRLALIDDCHLDADLMIENNSYSFVARLIDGVWVRIRSAQPDVVIPKDELLYY